MIRRGSGAGRVPPGLPRSRGSARVRHDSAASAPGKATGVLSCVAGSVVRIAGGMRVGPVRAVSREFAQVAGFFREEKETSVP
jgi:hypothetical protein